MNFIKRIFNIDVLETTKKIITPSFHFPKGERNRGALFHVFIKEEFIKWLNLKTYKNFYLSDDNKAFLEFDECFIEIPNLTPVMEREIKSSGATLIFFKSKGSQRELWGTVLA